jgi:hypothetical protein
VFTEYADWKASGTTKPCQDCHMPGEPALIATGSPKRKDVRHHGLFGKKGDLRTKALKLDVTRKGTEVTVALTNTGAGHAVPAGIPDRRIVVKVRALDASGAEVGSATRELGRFLVGADGKPAPFWRAVKVASDTRIQPGATWRETFTLPAAKTIEVDVSHTYGDDNFPMVRARK